jgi:hypothetical protein
MMEPASSDSLCCELWPGNGVASVGKKFGTCVEEGLIGTGWRAMEVVGKGVGGSSRLLSNIFYV